MKDGFVVFQKHFRFTVKIILLQHLEPVFQHLVLFFIQFMLLLLSIPFAGP